MTTQVRESFEAAAASVGMELTEFDLETHQQVGFMRVQL
jgi:hypothetical protein